MPKSNFQIASFLNPMANITIAGGLVPKGSWSAGTIYSVGDAPLYEGKTYICWNSGPAGTLPTDTNYFQPIA